MTKAGRPPRAGTRATARVVVRVVDEEKDWVDDAAEIAIKRASEADPKTTLKTPADWQREVLFAAARAILPDQEPRPRSRRTASTKVAKAR